VAAREQLLQTSWIKAGGLHGYQFESIHDHKVTTPTPSMDSYLLKEHFPNFIKKWFETTDS